MPAGETAVDLLDTSHGPARAHLHLPEGGAAGLLMLGTSYSGGVTAPDLRLATEVGVSVGWAVALVEQPWRVAGRRGRIPNHEVDDAWVEVAARLTADGLPLVSGGRSYGARIACRTAAATGAVGVLCLAFPLQPASRTTPSRQPELSGVAVPALVVQGDADPFGIPEGSATTRVVVVTGDHGLRKDHVLIRNTIASWLGGLVT